MSTDNFDDVTAAFMEASNGDAAVFARTVIFKLQDQGLEGDEPYNRLNAAIAAGKFELNNSNGGTLRMTTSTE